MPTAALVAPEGSRAGSAGTFIVAATNVAAMVPGTNIGAASPVGGGGGEELPETLQNKVTNDAAALMRDIAEQRER
ncbi:MAG: nodulation protein NfeD, partial [Dehalococcoidia bacterium]|nr:nodulation protein NfeD [Dehalococcoidia bacterium]